MNDNRTLIRSEEQNILSNGRVSMNPWASPMTFFQREFDFPLIFTSPISYASSNVFIQSLVFKECVFQSEINLGNYQAVGSVNFMSCVFLERVAVTSIDNVLFDSSCTFKKSLTVQNVPQGKDIRDLTIEEALSVPGSNTILSIFNIKSTNGNLIINIEGTCDNVTIADCSCKEIYINSLRSENTRAHIRKSTANKIAIQYRSSGCNVYLLECTINDLFFGNPFTGKNHISVKKSTLSNKVTLDLDLFLSAQVEASTVGLLELKGTNVKEGILAISTSKINNFLFQSVINDGLLSFNEVAVPTTGKISLLSSNLGKAKFINCQIAQAQFEFNNSQIVELFIAETDFPKEVFLANQRNSFQGQLAFGQLATVFQKQGDTARSLEYQSRELESHYRTINLFKKELRFLNLTKVALWLNKWSNDFGRNWGYGISFSFTVGFLFFYLLVISSKQYVFGFGLATDPNLVSSYLKFMNPLRFFDTESLFRLNTEPSYLTLTWSSYIWDFLGRVFVAYGFYQTIQAFRRFGRK